MTRTIALAAITLLALSALPVRVATAGETITGQVIDLACYMLDKANTTPTHVGRGYACAQACAKEGFQVGVLIDDGKVYEVVGGLAANKNAKLVPHMGHTVTITGDVANKDGFATISADSLTMASNRTK